MKLNKLFSTGLPGDVLTCVAGALTTLAFAPFHFFILPFITSALMLILWLNATPQRAFLRGYLYGLGLFGTGVYWIYISIHTFGNTPIFPSIVITGGLIALMAIYPALSGYFLNRYFPTNTNIKILCAFPAFWLLFDWIRSWLFTGFPWLFLGYTQMTSSLRGYATIFSVYGVTLIVLLCSALIVKIIRHIAAKEILSACSNLALIALIWIVGAILSDISWTKNFGAPIKVSLVQGNIPQEIKWSPESLMPTLTTYQKLSADHWNSELVIWPEAAIPIAYQDAESFLEYMNNMAKSHHANFITGIPIQIAGTESYYNAIIMLGENTGYYLKRRLVPFGEYVPFRGVFHKLLDLLNVPMSDFIPAVRNAPPLQVGKVRIAAFICYEIAFPELVLSRDGDINMLLTLSNDAWFGHSIAQAQHLEMGQMRALEMGRPVLFVSNNGITAIINAHGDVQDSAPQYQTAVLTGDVQPMQGDTPWALMGMTPILLIMLGMFFVAILERRGIL